MSYLLLYIPICLVILVVMEACRQDDPMRIAKRALINFAILTGVLVAGSAIVHVIQRWL